MELKDHVTLEEFDATFKASINSYYEHAKNDPSMTHEEVMSTTAQMSESYLEEREAFIASQEQNMNQTETTNEIANDNTGVTETTESIDNDVDGGIDDGGMDGGIE